VAFAYPGVTYNRTSRCCSVKSTRFRTTPSPPRSARWGSPRPRCVRPADQCGNPASANYHTCYPPAVNYIPAVLHDQRGRLQQTNSPASLFPDFAGRYPAPGWSCAPGHAACACTCPRSSDRLTDTGGAGMSLIRKTATCCGRGRVPNEVFMPAGKTYDVMATLRLRAAGDCPFPIYVPRVEPVGQRGGTRRRNAATSGINGSAIPNAPALTPRAGQPGCLHRVRARRSPYRDPSKGVIAQRHQTSTALRCHAAQQRRADLCSPLAPYAVDVMSLGSRPCWDPNTVSVSPGTNGVGSGLACAGVRAGASGSAEPFDADVG